jgi:SAM-dependent methyltransferase
MAENIWDQRYAGETFFYGTEPNDFLKERAQAIPAGGAVLCLAEGEGRNAVHLAQRGFRPTAVDGSATGLAKARALAAQRGVVVQTVHADLQVHEPGEAAWEGVVSIWCHLPPALRQLLHPRVLRALKPGGVLVLEHYHPRQLGYGTGGPKDPAMLLTLEELRRDFGALEELHAFEGERVVHEGAGHDGASFVTQFVARRRG